jgi:hypothetical protein
MRGGKTRTLGRSRAKIGLGSFAAHAIARSSGFVCVDLCLRGHRRRCLCRGWSILSTAPPSALGATGMAVRSSLECSLFPYGHSCVAGLACSRFPPRRCRPRSFRPATRGECGLDLAVFCVEARSLGICRDTASLGPHRWHGRRVLAAAAIGRHVARALLGVGNLRVRSYLRHLEVEPRHSGLSSLMTRPDSASLTDASSSLRCACGAAKRGRYGPLTTRREFVAGLERRDSVPHPVMARDPRLWPRPRRIARH